MPNSAVVVSETAIQHIVKSLARTILYHHFGRGVNADPKLFLVMANAALPFAADLFRELHEQQPDFQFYYEVLKPQSYDISTNTASHVKMSTPIDESLVKNRSVIILDTVFDTGATVNYVYDEVMKCKPARLEVCIFIAKFLVIKGQRVDYFGTTADGDAFLFGYGLDVNGLYRNIPEIRRVIV